MQHFIFVCDILLSRPAHNYPARKAVLSLVPVTTLRSEVISGGAGALGKHPPMDSTLLKPHGNSVK